MDKDDLCTLRKDFMDREGLRSKFQQNRNVSSTKFIPAIVSSQVVVRPSLPVNNSGSSEFIYSSDDRDLLNDPF